MGDLFDGTSDNRFRILENKATQIRKLLFGSLLLAKDTWKNELLSTPKGLDVMKTMEEAEEKFIDFTLTDPIEKLDSALSLINARARVLVTVIDYLAQNKPR